MPRPLGQHFLTNKAILQRIVAAAELKPEDLVVEIGAGKGVLTEIIASTGCHVMAIEVDTILCRHLKERFRDSEKVEILCDDVLEFDFSRLKEFKVVANIPYYITTPILFRLINENVKLNTAVVTLQKEVAERIVASAGSKKYGVLSIMVQIMADVEILFYIPRRAFIPPPKVDSAVIRIRRRSSPLVNPSDLKLFKVIVRSVFKQRRKYISNSLKGLVHDPVNVLKEAGISPQRRPETLSIDEFIRLTEIVKRSSHSV